jgi:hypothetical protein
MYKHHNPNISQPLISQLLDALGSHWYVSTYGNDSLASVQYETAEGQYITIFAPNAIECDPMQEEHSIFHVNALDKYYLEFETIEEVLRAFKDGEDEFIEVTEAIELKN